MIKGDSLIRIEAGDSLDHDGFVYLPSGLVSFFRITLASFQAILRPVYLTWVATELLLSNLLTAF